MKLYEHALTRYREPRLNIKSERGNSAKNDSTLLGGERE